MAEKAGIIVMVIMAVITAVMYCVLRAADNDKEGENETDN